MEILPNWHPLLVHFSIGLWTIAVILLVTTLFLPLNDLRQTWLHVARWNLWLGTAISVLTVAAGIYAYNTVAHDTPSHIVMGEHRLWALATFTAFLLLSVVIRWRGRTREGHPGIVITVFAVGALVVLMITGWHGAELVYRHGLGVKRLPQPDHIAPSVVVPGVVDPSRSDAAVPTEPHEHAHDHEHAH